MRNLEKRFMKFYYIFYDLESEERFNLISVGLKYFYDVTSKQRFNILCLRARKVLQKNA